MATYIILANFTEQGIRNVKDSPRRADAFKDMAQKAGVTVKELYWTLGAYDTVSIVEAPDDIAVTGLGLPWRAWQRTHPDAPCLFEGGDGSHYGQNGVADPRRVVQSVLIRASAAPII